MTFRQPYRITLAAALGWAMLGAPAWPCAPMGGGSPSETSAGGASPPSSGGMSSGSEEGRGSGSWSSGGAEASREGAAAAAGANLDSGDNGGPRRSSGETPSQNLTGSIASLGQALAADQAQTCQAGDGGTVQSQICADAQRQQMERWRIQQDTQTRIFEIQQDVTANRAKTQDKAFQTFDSYIRDDSPAPRATPAPTATPTPPSTPPTPPPDRGPPV